MLMSGWVGSTPDTVMIERPRGMPQSRAVLVFPVLDCGVRLHHVLRTFRSRDERASVTASTALKTVSSHTGRVPQPHSFVPKVFYRHQMSTHWQEHAVPQHRDVNVQKQWKGEMQSLKAKTATSLGWRSLLLH